MNFQGDESENNYYESNESPQFSVQSSQFINSPESNPKKSRAGNFTVEEDILLVSAWLNNSMDPVQGNEAKHKAYWTRVYEYFHKYKKFSSERNQVSLMNRWSTIQLVTNKFCGYYAQIESRNQSGANEQDKIASAKLLYQELHPNKPPFQFEHCWNILRRQPKWLQECELKKSTKKSKTASSPASPFTPETPIDLGSDDIPNDAFVDLERPPGRKAEKDRRKRKGKACGNESSNSSVVTLIQEMREEKKQFHDQKMIMFEKTYQQEQEILRLKQMKEDERIMLIDTSGMPQMLAEYYNRRQLEIIARGFNNS